MKIIIAFVAEVLRILLPGLIEAWKREQAPSLEEARPSGDLKKQLKARVLERWGSGRLQTVAVLLIIGMVLTMGCAGTRTILVPEGEPVRLRETIPQAKVWVLDKDGNPTAGTMDLPEGWYCLPVPETDNSVGG